MGRRNLPQRDLCVLWDLGTAAGQSDAELLRRFLTGPAEVSDLAFRTILARHGPMVLGACRRLLADGHDVEDAFQATFLVLVRRADSLRVTDTLGPWLHEVARRVALEARAIALRRRLREGQSTDLAAVPAHGSGVDVDDARAVIDEEVGRLNPNMRAAVVLCDLEGMTIEGAAHQLGWPSGTVRSRLARGRERLRSRLARRGFGPASEGLAGLPPAVVEALAPPAPVEALAASTTRLAVLSLSGITTAGMVPASVLTLTQGVLPMLFWNRAKTTVGVILAFIAIGAGIASAMLAEEPVRDAPVPRPVRDRTEQPATYHITGVVRVEGTGEPVPGARIQVFGEQINSETLATTSGPDGRYQVKLAPGVWGGGSMTPPAGYWAADPVSVATSNFVLSREAPVLQKDFVVRRGTIWDFQANHDVGSSDGSHVVLRATDNLEPEFTTEPTERNSRRFGRYPSETDEKGRVRLTLPTEARRLKLMATLRPSNRQGIASTQPVAGLLEWTTDFQPTALSRIEKTGHGYHLVDRAGRTADLRCGEEIELKESNGKPRIALRPKKVDRLQLWSLTGRVVDREGNPIEGANVVIMEKFEAINGLFAWNGVLTGSLVSEVDVVTDRDGRFLIPRLHFTARDEEPKKYSVSVRKQGYANAASSPFVFRPGENGGRHVVVEPVCLEPGLSLSGTVVDPSGKAVVGARVWGWFDPQRVPVPVGPTRTDDAGRFLLHGLVKGNVTLTCDYGELEATGKFTVDGKGEDVRIQVQPGRSAEFARLEETLGTIQEKILRMRQRHEHRPVEVPK